VAPAARRLPTLRRETAADVARSAAHESHFLHQVRLQLHGGLSGTLADGGGLRAMRKVVFENTGDEGPWNVRVDGEIVIEGLRTGDMDVSAYALDPLWAMLGLEVSFEGVF
jgi:hypothetical protein